MTGILIGRGNLDTETDMQREDDVKTQKEDSDGTGVLHLPARERQGLLAKPEACLCLLNLLLYWNEFN